MLHAAGIPVQRNRGRFQETINWPTVPCPSKINWQGGPFTLSGLLYDGRTTRLRYAGNNMWKHGDGSVGLGQNWKVESILQSGGKSLIVRDFKNL